MTYENFFNTDTFQIQVVAHGTTTDQVERPSRSTYEVSAWCIRLNHIALNQWHSSRPISLKKWEEEFATEQEAMEEQAARTKHRREWEATLMDQLQLTGFPSTVSITQNVAEYFTVISLRRI